jgi:hypothetical protein
MNFKRYSLQDLMVAYLYGVANQPGVIPMTKYLQCQRDVMDRFMVSAMLRMIRGLQDKKEWQPMPPCPQCGLADCVEHHSAN